MTNIWEEIAHLSNEEQLTALEAFLASSAESLSDFEKRSVKLSIQSLKVITDVSRAFTKSAQDITEFLHDHGDLLSQEEIQTFEKMRKGNLEVAACAKDGEPFTDEDNKVIENAKQKVFSIRGRL